MPAFTPFSGAVAQIDELTRLRDVIASGGTPAQLHVAHDRAATLTRNIARSGIDLSLIADPALRLEITQARAQGR